MGQRSEQILGMVLEAVGASEEAVAQSVQWAADHAATLDRRIVHEEEAEADDADHEEEDDVDERASQ